MDLTENSEGSADGEKLITQAQLNEIVRREKAAVAERVKREYEDAQSKNGSPTSQSQNQNMPNMADMEERMFNSMLERAKKMDEERLKREREQQIEQAKADFKVKADRYHLKMGEGKDKYSDFEEVMQDFEPDAFYNTVFLASEMENTADIMYELSKNPDKLARIDNLASKSPGMARRELTKLAESISANQQAKNDTVSAPTPLSRVKSSNVGADNGKQSLKDFKNADWLKV